MVKQRIFPVIRLVLAIFFCFFLYCMAAIFSLSVLWYLFYLMTGILLMSQLMVWHNQMTISYQKTVNATAYLKGSHDLAVILRQPRSLANVSVSLCLDETSSLLTPFREHSQVRYELDDECLLIRGFYQNAKINVSISDWFGFFKHTITIILDEPIVVLPQEKIKEATILNQKLSGLLAAGRAEHMLSFDLKNIRGYRKGDSFQQIDWKLSARKDHLLVKEYEVELEHRVSYLFVTGASPEFEPLLGLFYTYHKHYAEMIGEADVQLLNHQAQFLTLSSQTVAQLKESALTEELVHALKAHHYLGQSLILFLAEVPTWLNVHLAQISQKSQVTLVHVINDEFCVETFAEFNAREGGY